MKLRKTLVLVLAACLLIGTLASTAMAEEYLPFARFDQVEIGDFEGVALGDDGILRIYGTLYDDPIPYEGWLSNGTGNWAYYIGGIQQWYWQNIDGSWYWFNPFTGFCVMRGTAWIDNRLYVFDENGACVTTPGWYAIPQYFYVWDRDGQPSAYYPYGGTAWFYLDKDGYINTGWNYIEGNWYMCDRMTGAMLSDTWYRDDTGYWYYFDEYARMVKGWWTVKSPETNRTYYFNELGVLQWGWLNLAGKWYYLNDWNAARLENCWAQISGRTGAYWYLFDENGVMQTGWQEVVANPGAPADQQYSRWYYLTDWGAMVVGDQYIDGRWYYFNDVEGSGQYGELMGPMTNDTNFLEPAN